MDAVPLRGSCHERTHAEVSLSVTATRPCYEVDACRRRALRTASNQPRPHVRSGSR